MKNEKSFTPEEIKQGLHLDLINYLLDYNKKSQEYYYDIHITTDGYCTTIEWLDLSYDKDFNCESFEYVTEGQEVMTFVSYPDKSYDFAYSKEEADEMLNRWLNEHPGWTKDEYGHWINTNEDSLN